MKIKLSKSDWELIGNKTGWLKKQAKALDIDGVTYVNSEDISSNFWKNNYKISLGAIGTSHYLVNADNEQEAMDELIDYLEKTTPTVLFTPEEDEEIEFHEEYYTGGNHGRTLNYPTSEIRIEKIDPKEVAEFTTYFNK